MMGTCNLSLEVKNAITVKEKLAPMPVTRCIDMNVRAYNHSLVNLQVEEDTKTPASTFNIYSIRSTLTPHSNNIPHSYLHARHLPSYYIDPSSQLSLSSLFQPSSPTYPNISSSRLLLTPRHHIQRYRCRISQKDHRYSEKNTIIIGKKEWVD